MTTTTRRAALGALAGASALALPAVAIAGVSPGGDDELTALAAEIHRLCAHGEEVYAKGIGPFQEPYEAILFKGTAAEARASFDEACAYSHKVGREAAIDEQRKINDQAGRLWDRMLAIPAATQAGKIAKVRTLLTFVHDDEWRGPADDLDWEKAQTRSLLGAFAGMTEEELAAV